MPLERLSGISNIAKGNFKDSYFQRLIQPQAGFGQGKQKKIQRAKSDLNRDAPGATLVANAAPVVLLGTLGLMGVAGYYWMQSSIVQNLTKKYFPSLF